MTIDNYHLASFTNDTLSPEVNFTKPFLHWDNISFFTTKLGYFHIKFIFYLFNKHSSLISSGGWKTEKNEV